MFKRLVFVTIALVIVLIGMNFLSKGFVTDYSPYGIISFELANTFKDANAIMMAVGKTKLQVHTGIDFLFIITYAAFFFIIIKILSEQLKKHGKDKISFYFLELSVLAGIFDLVENIAMLITLGGYGSDISVGVSKWAAIAKFTTIALVVLYIIIVVGYLFLKKQKQ